MSEWDAVSSPADAPAAPSAQGNAEWDAVSSALPEDSTPAPTSSPGFFDRLSADYKKRDQQAADIIHNNDSIPGKAMEATGVVAGAGADLLGNVAGSLARSARDAAYQPDTLLGLSVTPETQKAETQTGDIARQGAMNFANTPVGQAIGQAGNGITGAYQDFTQNHPEVGRELSAAKDIVSVLPAAKLPSEVASSVAQVPGQIANTLVGDTGSFAKKLTMPIPKGKAAIDQATRSTEGGLLKMRIVQPNADEQAAIDAVSGLPIKKANSKLANYNIIDAADKAEAEQLGTRLQASGATYNPADVTSKLHTIANDLKNNNVNYKRDPAAQAFINDAVGTMQDLMNANPNTPKGLWDARKQFDNWAEQEQKRIFDNGTGVPPKAKEAIDAMRQVVNDHIDQTAPNAGVKESLARQSALKSAKENIAPKVAKEGTNSFWRLTDKVKPIARNPIAKPFLEGGVIGKLVKD